MSADYLFQQDKHYDVSFDTGDKVIQCGRHNDIFKFWLMWRAKVSYFHFSAFRAKLSTLSNMGGGAESARSVLDCLLLPAG